MPMFAAISVGCPSRVAGRNSHAAAAFKAGVMKSGNVAPPTRKS
jgi:hypothetical protein